MLGSAVRSSLTARAKTGRTAQVFTMDAALDLINSVQTRRIVKGEAQKCPLSGNFLGVFDFLRSACSLRIPLNTLLTVDSFSFLAYSVSFLAYNFSSFAYSWSFFAYSGQVRLIRALRDCKQ